LHRFAPPFAKTDPRRVTQRSAKGLAIARGQRTLARFDELLKRNSLDCRAWKIPADFARRGLRVYRGYAIEIVSWDFTASVDCSRFTQRN
jgi:hypothetical protein